MTGLQWSRRCVALDFRGKRCNRRTVCMVPTIFSWDPVKGVGVGGPHASLCRVHDTDGVRGDVRLEVVGGWLGDAWNPVAKCWTVCLTVYETRDGLDASPHWWSLRRPVRFGVCDDVVYDDAIVWSESR